MERRVLIYQVTAKKLSVRLLTLMGRLLVSGTQILSSILVYECEFNDGTIKEYSVNVIASNIYEEGDADGFSSSLLYNIVVHYHSD